MSEGSASSGLIPIGILVKSNFFNMSRIFGGRCFLLGFHFGNDRLININDRVRQCYGSFVYVTVLVRC